MSAVGITTFAFGLFVVPAAAELGVSRAESNVVLILISAGSALAAPITGKLVDRFPAGLVMAAGALSVGAGLLVVAFATSPLPIALAAFTLIAFGITCSGSLVATTIATRWFKRRLGRVLGVISTSATAGGIFVPPLAARLIELMGWRMALASLAAGFCVMALALAQWLIVDKPLPGEIAPAGEDEPETARQADEADDGEVWTYRRLMTNFTFWLIAAASSVLLANFFVIAVTLAPALMDGGTSMHAAALMVSALTAGAVASKLLIGFLIERVPARPLLVCTAAAHLVLLAVLALRPSYELMLVAVASAALGVGGVLPLQATLVRTHFGRRSFGTVLGLMGLIYQPFAIAATQLVGRVQDHAGSYGPAFAALMAVVALAGGFAAILPKSRLTQIQAHQEPSHV
jgi:MFS family permease